MNREMFDDYIRRFNAQDFTAFDDYLDANMHMTNGLLEYVGVENMKAHYAKIWKSFTEQLTVERFVCDGETLAVQLWAHFTAIHDDADSLFGAVQRGETFDFRGLIMYQIKNQKFKDIRVAYNSFTHTDTAGKKTEQGIPH